MAHLSSLRLCPAAASGAFVEGFAAADHSRTEVGGLDRVCACLVCGKSRSIVHAWLRPHVISLSVRLFALLLTLFIAPVPFTDTQGGGRAQKSVQRRVRDPPAAPGT